MSNNSRKTNQELPPRKESSTYRIDQSLLERPFWKMVRLKGRFLSSLEMTYRETRYLIFVFMPFTLLYVTHPSKPEAIRITADLLNTHLITCANFFPIESMYWWEGRLTKNDEIVTIYKTRTENVEKVQKKIEELHKYEVPCIIRLAEVSANESYEKWIQDNSIL